MPNRNFEVLPYPLHMCVIFKNCLKYESNKFVSNMLWNITLNIRARNLSCNLAAIITRHSFVKVDNILFKSYRIWFQSTSLDYLCWVFYFANFISAARQGGFTVPYVWEIQVRKNLNFWSLSLTSIFYIDLIEFLRNRDKEFQLGPMLFQS